MVNFKIGFEGKDCLQEEQYLLTKWEIMSIPAILNHHPLAQKI